MSQPVIVVPRGPHQRRTCSGLLCASNTRRRGASKTRVSSISRSDFKVSVMTPTCRLIGFVLLLVTTCFLPFLKLGQIGIELTETLVPDPAIGIHPVGSLLQPGRLEPARSPLRLPALCDQAGALEHFEVLRDSRQLQME